MLSTACYDGAMAKPAPAPRSGLRKLPTQARSRARVEAILKAAGALLGEVGYDGVTTNLIAERAGVPVGSIYQFFETKDDIIAALVERFQERIHRLAGEELDGASAARDRRAFIAKLVDGIAGIQAESISGKKARRDPACPVAASRAVIFALSASIPPTAFTASTASKMTIPILSAN